MFPDLRGLAFVDDGNIIGRISQDLKLISASNPVFKLDGNLDFNLVKTMFLAKGTTDRHVYDRANFFLQNDPSLQDIAHDFTLNMLSVQGIEVWDSHRHRHLRQGIGGAELSYDNKGCGEA